MSSCLSVLNGFSPLCLGIRLKCCFRIIIETPCSTISYYFSQKHVCSPNPASQTCLEKSEQMPRLHSLSSWFKVLGKISQTFPGWTKFPSIWTEHVGHCAHSAWSGIMTLSPLVSDKAGPLWSTADFCLCHLLLALSPTVPCHTASAPLV